MDEREKTILISKAISGVLDMALAIFWMNYSQLIISVLMLAFAISKLTYVTAWLMEVVIKEIKNI